VDVSRARIVENVAEEGRDGIPRAKSSFVAGRIALACIARHASVNIVQQAALIVLPPPAAAISDATTARAKASAVAAAAAARSLRAVYDALPSQQQQRQLKAPLAHSSQGLLYSTYVVRFWGRAPNIPTHGRCARAIAVSLQAAQLGLRPPAGHSGSEQPSSDSTASSQASPRPAAATCIGAVASPAQQTDPSCPCR
jgi:hypothetical protein